MVNFGIYYFLLPWSTFLSHVMTPYPINPLSCPMLICRLYLPLLLSLYSAINSSAQPAIPKFETLKTISSTQVRPLRSTQPVLLQRANPLPLNDPYREQNIRIMELAGQDIPGRPSNTRQQQLEELRALLREEAGEMHKLVSRPFESNFQQFLRLNPDNFSITRAVYLTESAYDPELPPYETFEAAITEWAEFVKQIVKREDLTLMNNTAINYAIQKIYQQPNIFYSTKRKVSASVQPLSYDFNDPMGYKDWRKMFVSKLLHTRTGQCHSLPLFFLCVAEQLNTKAYLSLSPNHSFIQYFDEDGHRYNFECTNGNLVTQTWLMQSTYINATALKNGTYLDTLSSKQLYAQCLADLLLGYIHKLGYDGFSNQVTKQILSIDSNNIAALMTRANHYQLIFQDKLQAAGNPPQDAYPSYPQLFTAYNSMMMAQQKVEQTGFQEMPEEAYLRWLKSVEPENQQRQNKAEQERLRQKMNKLKNIKPTFINKPKD